jgi:hypothetical protein
MENEFDIDAFVEDLPSFTVVTDETDLDEQEDVPEF